jgi:hypothetical protein
MADELSTGLSEDTTTRRDVAIMRMEMEAIHDRLARVPTQMELARAALGIIFCTPMIMIAWIEFLPVRASASPAPVSLRPSLSSSSR